MEVLQKLLVKPQIDPEVKARLEYIKSNEGFRDRIYKDTKGKNTIGYGFNLDDSTVRKLVPADVVSGKRPLTKAEAEPILMQLSKVAENDAMTYVGAGTYKKMSPFKKMALNDMAYNMGLAGLNSFDDMRAALVSDNTTESAKQLLDSKYAREDVPLRALKNAALIVR